MRRDWQVWYVNPDDPLRDHPWQYAVGTLNSGSLPGAAYGTENADDDAVRAAILRAPGNLTTDELHMLKHPRAYPLRLERFNRCPTDEQWQPCNARLAAS